MFFISENSADLQNFISDMIEVNELSSILEQVNCKSMYYVIWNANIKNDFVFWWNQYSAIKKIKKSDSWCTHLIEIILIANQNSDYNLIKQQSKKQKFSV